MAEQDPTIRPPAIQTQPKRQRGNGRIFPRKGTTNLWCAYYLRGREIRESTGMTDRKKAERFLERRLKEVGADQIGAKPFGGPQQDRLEINQLLDALKADYELRGKLTPQFGSHLARIRGYFGAVRATALSSEAVDKYIREQLEAGFKPATVNRGTQLLRQAYALAITRRHLHSMPSIRHLDESDNVRQGYFEEPDLRRVVSYLPEYLQDFTLYAFLTGWRKGGIKNLRWPDIAKQIVNDKGTQERMEVEVVFLPARYWKNREPQTMPLVGELSEIIARRRAARAVATKDGIMLSEFIFHRDGKLIGDMRKAWNTACKLAGVSGRLFHDLCRTFARNADNDGVSRSVAKEIMGRKTEAIYARYRIVAQGEKVSALLRMQQRSFASPGRVVTMPSVAVQ
jgi:integrase